MFELPDEDRIVIAGDWHGDARWAAIVLDRCADLGIRTVLHVGDLGLGPWPGDGTVFQDALEVLLTETQITMLTAMGNHDNWSTAGRDARTSTELIEISPHLHVVPQGFRWRQNGVTFGGVGGAVSVDRAWRFEGEDWWPDEATTAEDVARLGSEPLDVLLTHDAPAVIETRSRMVLEHGLAKRCQDVRDLLQVAVAATKPKVSFAGHWHQYRQHTHAHPDGQSTEMFVLQEEYGPNNAVVLDLALLTNREPRVRVRPLQDVWREVPPHLRTPPRD